MHIKKIALRLSVCIVITAMTLVSMEAALRTFWPLHFCGFIGAYEYDEVLGTKLKPSQTFTRLTDHLQEVHTNQLGTVNYQESFDDYQQLVFCIGDSYTQGTGVGSDSSYPFQLGLSLNTRDRLYERRYGVVNLGLSAYGVEQARLALARFRDVIGTPDYVLWLGCPNDNFDDRLFLDGYRHRSLVDGSPHWGKLVKPLQWFANYSEIGKRLKLLVSSKNRQKKASQAKDCKQGMRKENTPLPKQPLECLAAQCDEMGAELLVSWTLPSTESNGTYESLRSWSASHPHVRFVDWYPLASSVATSAPPLPLKNSHSGGHYRPWVNRVIADAFARAIENDSDLIHREKSVAAKVNTMSLIRN